MPTDAKFISAFSLVTQDNIARQTFERLTTQIGLSGWAIARESHLQPELVESALGKLVQQGVIKADGQGLDAYYAPTGSGFFLKEQLALN